MHGSVCTAWALIGAVGVCFACSDNLASDGVDPPFRPGAGSGDACTSACGENDVGMTDSGVSPPMTVDGDPMAFVSIGEDRFGGFFEPVEVQVVGDRIALCTGVRGLVFYRAADPCCVSAEVSIRPAAGNAQYPRCQHFAIDGDRAFITNRGDELQPTPFIDVVDITDIGSARPLYTLRGGPSTSFEAVAVWGAALYAAQHEEGLGVYEVAGDGRLTLRRLVIDGVVNAWKPVLDPGRGFLYLADAQGGLSVYSIADPFNPVLVAKVATEGTIKEVVQVGDVLYAASGVAGVEVFDVVDPANASKVRRLDTPGSALGVAATTEHLVVADWRYVQLFRLDDPRNPTYVGHQKAYVRSGEPDYSGRILDVAVRDNAFFIAEWANVQAHRIVPNVDSPDLIVSGVLEMPRTAAGATNSAAVALENVGNRTLVITSISAVAPYSVDTSSIEIAPKSRGLVTVTFAPQTTAEARGTLTIISNDPDEGRIDIAVRGNAPGLRPGDIVPNLAFNDLRGFTVDLESQRGHPVLLAYFATF